MKRYYINNNSIGNLKVFDEANNCIAKIKHFPMSTKYLLVNNNERFLLRIDETNPMQHIFSVSFDEEGNYPTLEIAKKNNFKIGFGLGHLVLLPFATISKLGKLVNDVPSQDRAIQTFPLKQRSIHLSIKSTSGAGTTAHHRDNCGLP